LRALKLQVSFIFISFILASPNSNLATIISEALLELDSSTGLNKALLSLLKNSFFEKKTINWKPVKCELVVNTKLTEEFQRKFFKLFATTASLKIFFLILLI